MISPEQDLARSIAHSQDSAGIATQGFEYALQLAKTQQESAEVIEALERCAHEADALHQDAFDALVALGITGEDELQERTGTIGYFSYRHWRKRVVAFTRQQLEIAQKVARERTAANES